jgi:hypothetical protein
VNRIDDQMIDDRVSRIRSRKISVELASARIMSEMVDGRGMMQQNDEIQCIYGNEELIGSWDSAIIWRTSRLPSQMRETSAKSFGACGFQIFCIKLAEKHER